MAPIIATDDAPTGPPDDERLAWERASRAVIRRIFDLVMEDRWRAVLAVYHETREQGEWFTVAVWAGLPNTLKDRIRELNDEDFRTR